jgi:long-chain fatty acid transport protein
MKQLARVVGISIACTAALQASGYKIPEQSLNATALSAANIAAVKGADASYYNPANMAWMEDGYQFEGSLTYINLPKVKFQGVVPTHSGDSKVEHFIAPAGHFVTKEIYENWRFGFSMVAPGGLSKRWESPFAKTFAEEFSLTIIEANPTAAYRVNDRFAIGFGLRMVYTDGVVKSDGRDAGFAPAARDLTGDSIDYGYNLALSYRASEDLKLAATYRSNVDLTVDGKAKLYAGPNLAYNGGATVEIPLPATLALAAAYTMDKTTVELVYERVFWSKYKNLDFNYDVDLTPTPLAAFDVPTPKNWKDSNTYRIGVTHKYSDKLTLMAGYAHDETPVPDGTIGFELPDSDANIYSAGLRYKVSKDIDVGLAYLYSDKQDRTTATSAPNHSYHSYW